MTIGPDPMPDADDWYYTIEYSSGSGLYWEPNEHYETVLVGHLLVRNLMSDVETKVGYLAMSYLDLELARCEGADRSDSFDSSNESHQCFASLYSSRKRGYHTKLQRLLGCEWIKNLLLVREIVIAPDHRGKYLGQYMLVNACRRFARLEDVIALNPAPLRREGVQDEHRRSWLDGLPADKAKSQKKLRAFYRNLGFVAFDRQFMVSTVEKLPHPRELPDPSGPTVPAIQEG